jgi:hypothetical protein
MMGVRISPPTPNNVRVPERPNGAVCKTVVRRFESDSSLHAPVAKLVKAALSKGVLCIPVRVRAGVPKFMEVCQSPAY